MFFPKTKLARREALSGYLYISPWIFGFLLFTAIPIFASFYLAFTSYRGYGEVEWIGIGNFIKMFADDDIFWQSAKVTLIYVIGFLPPGLVLGYSIALLMNQHVRGITLFRTIYYLPAILTGVAVAMMWQFVFHREFGVLNAILGWVGIAPISWLNDTRWVMVAFIIMGLWGVGDGMIIYLAGLQSIPTDLYEASTIDGANPWQKLWKITIPLTTPGIFFNLVTGLIKTFQVFIQPFIMTEGGPNYATFFFSLNIYYTTFRSLRLGYASAMALVLFFLILGLTSVVLFSSSRWVYYSGGVEVDA
ncbi:sugar ABC transporter permease [Chloroflexi bacterium TSY]|nr:sugar ABC transporter permease [Chloroflexi bacterium TSY]